MLTFDEHEEVAEYMQSLFDVKTKLESVIKEIMARQRTREKFKPTKGAFGNKSKYQKSLERQAELRKQIAEFEAKQAENAKKAESKTETAKKAVKPKAKKAEKSKRMPPLQLSKDQNSAFNDITDWYVYHQNSVPFLTMGGYAGLVKPH